MALANCSVCGKLFNKVSNVICPVCFEQRELDFEKVYNFIKEHGPMHIDHIHKETGVEKKLIMKFLAEGRFEAADISYKCDSCGATITSGKLCAKCVASINAQIAKMSQDGTRPEQPVKAQGYLGQSSLDRYQRKD